LKQDTSSGYAAVRRGAGLVDRSWTGRILLTGADRRSYLQGLLTNDIAALTPGTGCYAAMSGG
jgi:glycine cleavage system aminomethyltransferase T